MATTTTSSPSLAVAGTAAAPSPATARDLAALIHPTAPSSLEPLAFFVSWQGVLTLAYTGFPPALLDLKRRISASHPALPPESPGSLWPKTSVGCLRDGVTLTEAQFHTLNALCKDLSARLLGGGGSGSGGNGPHPPRIVVDSASIAIYACRSQERLIFSHTVTFEGATGGEAGPSAAERRRVRAIVDEADAADYYPKVAREGNREAHYCAPALGSTLLHQLPLVRGVARTGGGSHAGMRARGLEEVHDRQRLLRAIKEFREGVEAALPGCYQFFSEDSLHVTLRALIL